MAPNTAAKVAAVSACGLLAGQAFVSQPATPETRVSAAQRSAAAAPVPSAASSLAPSAPLALGLGLTAAAVGAASRRQVKRSAFDPSAELGVQAPVRYWDPLGLGADGDEATFKRRRAVEIKHGRISMLACIGYIVPEYFRFPGYLSPSQDIRFTDVPNGFAAFSKVPLFGWAQILVFAGMMEGRFLENQTEPGNFGFGNLGACGLLGPVKDPAERARKLNAEIANGRLAMFAIMGLFFQNGVTGTTGSELYGFGENSGTIFGKFLIPTFVVLGLGGESFRRGPDDNFRKYFDRKDYFGYQDGKDTI